MPSNIDTLIIHHSGGIGNQNDASSAHLTAQKISDAHKARWNFPSNQITGPTRYAGYNVIYDPKTRAFIQCRAIGEETAHTIGYNFRSVGICIIGNFNRKSDGKLVDPLTNEISEDVTKFLHDLINGNKRGLQIAKDTTLDLSTSRVKPHRFYGTTECYGTGIPDNHFFDLLIKYKPVVVLAPDGKSEEQLLEERNAIVQAVMKLLARLQEIMRSLEAVKKPIGAGDRACTAVFDY